MRADDTKKRLGQTLAAMPDSHFLAGAQTLLTEMGYHSTRTLPDSRATWPTFSRTSPPPTPSPLREGQYPVTLPARVAAKLAIYAAMCLQGMTHAALAARLDTSARAVRQLLDLDHGSHASEVEKALRVVGRDSMIEESATQFPKV